VYSPTKHGGQQANLSYTGASWVGDDARLTSCSALLSLPPDPKSQRPPLLVPFLRASSLLRRRWWEGTGTHDTHDACYIHCAKDIASHKTLLSHGASKITHEMHTFHDYAYMRPCAQGTN
jgi:hypothetical protein